MVAVLMDCSELCASAVKKETGTQNRRGAEPQRKETDRKSGEANEETCEAT